MSALYIVQAQPNPPGKDASRRGQTTNHQLNEEWTEFEAVGGPVAVTGQSIAHLTFAGACQVTGQATLMTFGDGSLSQGRRLRLHTGRGTNAWAGNTYHMYLNKDWFVWNNQCGDRCTVTHQNRPIDSAGYAPNPPEGVLSRVPGTDRLEPARQLSYR